MANRKKDNQGESALGCFIAPFYLLWMFIRPFLAWGAIGLIIVWIMQIAGCDNEPVKQKEISKNQMQAEMEQQMLEEAHEGFTGWDWMD